MMRKLLTVIYLAAVLLLDALGFAGNDIHQRHDPAALGELQIGLNMGVGDAARAHDSYFDHRSFTSLQVGFAFPCSVS